MDLFFGAFAYWRDANFGGAQESLSMGKRIYVGNLPLSVTEAELTEMFTECGSVASTRLIIEEKTGQSKGFAFIEMTSEEDAQRGIAAFQGKQIEGRQLAVTEARPHEARPLAVRRGKAG